MEILEILKKARVIAVIGANDKPGRPVDRVGRYLIKEGYTVVPVHPVRKLAWGRRCFPSMSLIDMPVDIVVVFRAAAFCAGHASEAMLLSPKPMLFWLQSGIRSNEAERLLCGSGIRFVEDACLMVEHARLLGKSLADI